MKFENKKIAVLGLGLEGQDAARFFLKKNARVVGYDRKELGEIGEEALRLEDEGVKLVLGTDYLASGLTDFDLIVRSPGVRLDLLELRRAAKAGVQITSPTKLFLESCPAKIIGVTGTKGKGTVSTLIYRILLEEKRQVGLLGNIGSPALGKLDSFKKNDWVVYELSSFQLQDLTESPHIAVVLFIATDHLDYHASREEYVEAKSQLVRHQKKGDFAVVNIDDQTSASFAKLTKGKVVSFSRLNREANGYVEDGQLILKIDDSKEIIGPTSRLKIVGQHNWDNVLAASLATSLAGVSLCSIQKAVYEFEGLEHRLELCGQLDQIRFYNDSFSTTPETAIAAIRAFGEPTVLIVGGSDKGADFTQLGEEIASQNLRGLIVIGQMGPKIKRAALEAGYKGKVVDVSGGIFEATQKAFLAAVPEGIVVLSPACASFDMFKNYKDRGRQFRLAVKTLLNDTPTT